MRRLLPLQFVETIAKLGSIRRAAETLAITPSALNRRLQSVEEELGMEIFERVPTGVRLNTAGEIFLQHIRNQAADMDRVRSQLADLSGMRRGDISIVASAEFVGRFLPGEIARHRAEFPGVNFRVEQSSRGRAEAALQDLSADIALIFEPLKLVDFQIVFTAKQPLMCLLARDHDLAGRDKVRLYECRDYPLLLPDEASGIRNLIDTAAVRLGLELPPAIEANVAELLHACAAHSGQIAFDVPVNLPDDLAAHGLTAVPVDPRDAGEGFLFVGHLRGRTLPVASARFLEQITASLAAKFD